MGHVHAPLCFLQWNCRSISKKVPVLQHYLNEKRCDVLAIQSLKVAPKSLPLLEGYYYPPEFALNKGKVAVATYVRDTLTYRRIDPPVPDMGELGAMCTVQIVANKRKATNLVNVYYPEGCDNPGTTDWLSQLQTDCNWVVVGDFNSHNPMWDPGPLHKVDWHLADSIYDSELVLLNDGSTTRIPDVSTHRASAIDLTLVSPCLAANAEWTAEPDTLQSDHNAILIRIHNVDTIEPDVGPPKYRLAKADWAKFQATLDSVCEEQDFTDNSVDQYYANIREAILSAADKAIPKGGNLPRGKAGTQASWWNDECTAAVKRKRQCIARYQKNLCQKNLKEVHDATQACDEVMEKAKSDDWEEFCTQEVRDHFDAPKVWKRLRARKRGGKAAEKPLTVDGRQTTSNLEKAEVLARTFAGVSLTQNLPAKAADHRAAEEKKFVTPAPDNTMPINSDFTLKDLAKAIAGIKTGNVATGTDPISYKMIQHLPDSMLEKLLLFFQACWEGNCIPQAWREALVVAIPKEGKPKNSPSSYRPISLTPHLGKIYERMVKNRLEFFLDKHNVIPLFQAGFRKGRNCMEHVVRLTAHAKRALTRNRILMATFFDIRRAFDTVWHGKLLDKLAKLGLSGRILGFVQEFLRDRTLAVRVGQSVSKSHSIDMGVPQGSIIAPILFSLMLHDIGQIGLEGGTMSLYADDLAFWMEPVRHHMTEQNRLKYQAQIDKIAKYMLANGFELSHEKTVFLVFTRRRGLKAQYHLTLNGMQIKPSKTAKFLGVTISDDLIWQQHIDSLIVKARRSVNLIKVLKSQTWAAGKALVHLVKALVRSRLTYGQEAYFSMPQSLWNKLERLELSALKLALGVPKGAINCLAYQEAGMIPLKEECHLRCAQFVARASAVPNTVQEVFTATFHPTQTSWHETWKEKKTCLAERYETLHDHTIDVLTQCQIDQTRMAELPTNPYPSWLIEKPQISHTYGDAVSKKENPLLLATMAKEILDGRLRNYLKVYTDGSVLDNGEVGCAFAIPEFNLVRKYKLNEGVSIFTAEMYAILMACSHVNDNMAIPMGVAILSDSKSSLQALASETGNRPELRMEIQALCHQIMVRGTDLVLMWLPSHTGIRGNDLADRAAKAAALSEGPVLDLKYSVTEAKGKLAKAVRKGYGETLKERCTKHGWLALPPDRKGHHHPFPLKEMQLLRRIRTVSSYYSFTFPRCECGMALDFHHLFAGCQPLTPEMATLSQYRTSHGLSLHDFLRPHQSLGLIPMRTLTRSILKSSVAKWF